MPKPNRIDRNLLSTGAITDQDNTRVATLSGVIQGQASSVMIEAAAQDFFGHALPPGTMLKNQYRIIKTLGCGGFGITYLAKDIYLKRHLVIKENFPQYCSYRDPDTGDIKPNTPEDIKEFNWSIRNFLNEARLLAAFKNKNIVDIHSIFDARGTAYFSMDYVEGKALSDMAEELLVKNRRYTEEEMLGLLYRILLALEYVHTNGILHRDIKLANIILNSDGKPVLIDFGSARSENKKHESSRISSRGYSPPEQELGVGTIGPWTDIYALGATFYTILISDTPDAASQRMLKDTYQPLAKDTTLRKLYSMDLLVSIDKALMLDPTARWQSTKEWRYELKPIMQRIEAAKPTGNKREAAKSSYAESLAQRGKAVPAVPSDDSESSSIDSVKELVAKRPSRPNGTVPAKNKAEYSTAEYVFFGIILLLLVWVIADRLL